MNNTGRKSRFRPKGLVVLMGLATAVGFWVWIFQAPTRPADSSPSEQGGTQAVAVAQPAGAVPLVPIHPSALEENWGIQVRGLWLTNNNMAVELRYTVVAPEKTILLADTNAPTYLINQADGAKLPMISPTEGSAVALGASTRTARRMMRGAGQFPPSPSRLVAGGTYSLQIPNWGQALQIGSRVSLVVGEFRQDGLTIE